MNSIINNNPIGKLQERFQSRNELPVYTDVTPTGSAPFQIQVCHQPHLMRFVNKCSEHALPFSLYLSLTQVQADSEPVEGWGRPEVLIISARWKGILYHISSISDSYHSSELIQPIILRYRVKSIECTCNSPASFIFLQFYPSITREHIT